MTVKQIQCLLAYLGYYSGAVDGIWGPLSARATEEFQRAFVGLTADGETDTDTQKALRHAVSYDMFKEDKSAQDIPEGDVWKKVRYWTRAEFGCRCGQYHAPYCDGFPVEPDENLVLLAEDIRTKFGRPGIPTSGIRCQRHNADQPNSAANSRHVRGKALDWFITGVSGEQLLAAIKADGRAVEAYIIEGNIVHMAVA